MADLTLPHEFQKQINYYYCGPAATRVALTPWGIYRTQQELAAQLGTTTTYGTNSSEDVVRVMNAWLGAGKYESEYIGGSVASPEATTEFRWTAVDSINKWLPVVCNVVGPIRSVDGFYATYPGGHYVTIVGYKRDGEEFLVADVDKHEYWVDVQAMATWIAGRGYSRATQVAAAPTPPPQPSPPTDTSTVYIIDLASYQEGINLEQAKAAGVQAVNIKTSEGMGYTWGRAKDYADYARSLGMGICTFHWLDSSGSGVAQAQRAYELMVYLGNGSPAGMAHQCDCEDDANYTIFAEYMTEFQRLLGRPIMLYTGDWWWTGHGNWNGAQFTPYLWAAPNDGYLSDYPGDSSPHWNAGYGGWDVLSGMQFAVSPVSGFNGNVSKTMIRRTAWNALVGVAAQPEQEEDMYWIFAAGGKAYKSDGLHYQEVPSDEQSIRDIKYWLGEAGGAKVVDVRSTAFPAVPEHVFGKPVNQCTVPPITVPPATVSQSDIKAGVKQALKEGTD